MDVWTTVAELQSNRSDIDTDRRVLVPTMGALHAGHGSLIRVGVEHAERLGGVCVVSVFVNPTQFDDASDFDRYPRELDADLELCAEAGAASVFAPGVGVMYPPGVEIPRPEPPPEGVDRGLEDAHRPGHFEGVCQVVRRLFDLVTPIAAVFGEKDWQQLRVLASMATRDGLGVDVVGAPTVREDDGLAMSSRNRFLDREQRARAAMLPLALEQAGSARHPGIAEEVMREFFRRSDLEVDYAAVRDAATLGTYEPGRPGRALAAVRLGSVRLLDNAPWPIESGAGGPHSLH
ncbi:MAG: pantoate--beta-alanine ligase [Planctomycetota bacterium]